MSRFYVDSSCLVAVAFQEDGYRAVAKLLDEADELRASNLLEAELRAALVREGVQLDPSGLLQKIVWILPDRPLSAEIQRVLSSGHLRGADVWHLAHALWVDPRAEALAFLTLDDRQGAAARRLGFRSPRLSR